MKRSKKPPEPQACRVHLTGQAVRDICEIQKHSIEKWGISRTREYLRRLELALDRIRERPDLLRQEPAFASALRFYRVEKHLLVCDVQDDSIVVLTVFHCSMDIQARIAELQPTVNAEVAWLHRKLRDSPPQ